MAEIIFNTDSYETLLSEAKRLGFSYIDENNVDHIIINGPMKDGGSYFLNYVGIVYQPTGNKLTDGNNIEYPEMTPLSGVWGRLRANGNLENLPIFSNVITQYVYSENLQGWTNDGTTLAPEYIQNIGLIA